MQDMCALAPPPPPFHVASHHSDPKLQRSMDFQAKKTFMLQQFTAEFTEGGEQAN